MQQLEPISWFTPGADWPRMRRVPEAPNHPVDLVDVHHNIQCAVLTVKYYCDWSAHTLFGLVLQVWFIGLLIFFFPFTHQYLERLSR